MRGGLSVMDYLKVVTVQQYTRAGLGKLGPPAIALAQAEGLVGHAEAIRAKGDRWLTQKPRLCPHRVPAFCA